MADIEQQALEMIATECDSFGHPDTASYIRERGKLPEDWRMSAPRVLRLIVAALASQGEQQIAPDAESAARAYERYRDAGATHEQALHAALADALASKLQAPAAAVPEDLQHDLLMLAADFETCIPFLPKAGARNIGNRVLQLRRIAMGIAAAPAPEVSGG